MLDVVGRLYPTMEIDTPRDDCSLKVISCGHYMLINRQECEVWRPNGRQDYQLLYIHAGQAFFEADGQMRAVQSGSIVLYQPKEPQHYYYVLPDHPDIYWLHFTGAEAKQTLAAFDLFDKRIFSVGIRDEYCALFDRIVQELQLKHPFYSELADAYFRELLCLMSREATGKADGRVPRTEVVEEAVRLFHTQFNRPFSVAEYAEDCGLSACWFTRQFTRQMGVSPQQYLTDVRISKARELLTSPGSISEIGAIVGYQDPLYFSRIFKKHTGYSPRAYQKMMTTGGM